MQRARPGRPRDPEVDEAILATTLDLLLEDGYAQLTMDRVAALAGVGKASLYRRWPTKTALVLHAMRCRAQDYPQVPDTGSLRGDMLAYLRALIRTRKADTRAIWAIASEVISNAELGDVFRRQVSERLLAGFQKIVQRAVDRGELPSSTDVELMAAVPPALLHSLVFLQGRQPDERFARRIVDQLFSRARR